MPSRLVRWAALLLVLVVEGLTMFLMGLMPLWVYSWGMLSGDRFTVLGFVAVSGLMAGFTSVVWTFSTFVSHTERLRALAPLVAMMGGLCGGSYIGAQWWQPVHVASQAGTVMGTAAGVGLLVGLVLSRTRWRHIVVGQFRSRDA